jgi:hypothetical protein
VYGRTRLALTTALLGSAALTPVTAFAAPLPTCSQLATNPAYGLAGNASVAQTASDNQGQVSPSATLVPATSTNAAYCLVHLQYSGLSGPTNGYAPGESETIGLNIGLPLNSTDGGAPVNPKGYSWTAVNGAWNGKVENMGGGGLIGTIGAVVTPANAGYIGSSTDGGHNTAQNGGTTGAFGVIQATNQLDTGKITDYAAEAQHQQYLWSLALAKQYYGQPAARNYWNGCSTGGRQGLQLAQEWGTDFDGILAGAPVVYTQGLDLSHLWPAVVNRDYVVAAGHPAITTAQYGAAVASAIAACDVEGTDVVADGVVDDPRQCTWNPVNNICGAPGAPAAPNCLDSVQAAGLTKIWNGTRNHHGRLVWFPWEKVQTGGMLSLGPTISGAQQAQYWDHMDLNYNVQNVYSSRALAAANPLGEPNPISLEDEWLLADGPGGPQNVVGGADYLGIIANVHNGPKHGKIIMWQGAADPMVPWQDGVHFYRAVATAYGGGTTDFGDLSSWYRYYHAPGVGHCGGGAGADPTATVTPDGQGALFDDLVNWVENGVVPQSAGDTTHMGILATGPANVGTRPICPWPTTAIYNGSGPTTVASNYHCGGNLESYVPTPATNNVATICQELVTAYDAEDSNTLDYAELGITPAQCPLPAQVATHDFNAEGDSDVLWRDATGNVGIWLMNGTTIAKSSVLGNVATTWSVIGQRDFNGDGYSDMLWRDNAGNVGIWLMNGTTVKQTAVLGNVSTTWSVAATGDFNGDGSGDILWQDNAGNLSVWYMNGTAIGQVATIGNLPTNWKIFGADSNGNVFWRNTTTGEVGIFVINGTQIVQTVNFGVVPLTWSIAGIGDFDGNGSTDILWRDNAGNVGIWLLKGTQIQSSATLGNVPLNWTVVETGDYNGDGNADVLWKDSAGNVGVWFMNGATVSSSFVYGNVGTAWNVQSVNAD